jgi:Ni/Co efflux regulator RcnB
MRKLGLMAAAATAALVLPSTAMAADAQPGQGHWQSRGAAAAASAAGQAVQHRGMREVHRQVGPGGHHVRQLHDKGRHHGRRFGHISRINRGGFVPHGWFGPQFVVRNWNGYGFPQPFSGGRWIRYYDDALLIDRHGRVHDGRYGYDWDRHQDRWSHDDRGVPVYVGDGDFEPEDYDYEWAERYDRGDVEDGYAGDHGPPPRHGGYGGHGYGYGGYGACACGPVVVTETITTTAPVVEQVTYYEYETEYVRERAAPKKRKVIRRAAPAPRPRPGERG